MAHRFIPLLCVLAMLSALALPACAQNAQQELDLTCPEIAGAPSPLTLGRRLVGNDCGVCHSQGGAGDTSWILRNEFPVWHEQDRHSKAYVTLLGDRSKRMGQLLGVDDVSRDARCLTCHSSLPAEVLAKNPQLTDQLLEPDGADQRYGARALLADGVACEACHGAAGAGAESGWFEEHWRRRDWRYTSPEEKQSQFGYYDVRSPTARTRMCVSCHVGDPQRGRLVTHEMYAAGHPPLPPFEVETFLRQMPPHWRRVSTAAPRAGAAGEAPGRKSTEVSRDFLARTEEPYYAQMRQHNPAQFNSLQNNTNVSFERTRSLAIGAIVTWAQNARVTAELASTGSYPLISNEHRWPELAAFECAACHHDLKLSGWRALRQPPSTPGRPVLRNWSSPLTAAVFFSLAERDLPTAIASAEKFLQSATRTQPYGDREEIAVRLAKAADQADAMARGLEGMVFSQKQAKRLLVRIAQVGEKELMEYEAARQVVWAADVVLRELDPQRSWRESHAALDAVKRQLTTDLAVHQPIPANLQPRGGTVQQVKLVDLPRVLGPAAEYDAARMQRGFTGLITALAAEL